MPSFLGKNEKNACILLDNRKMKNYTNRVCMQRHVSLCATENRKYKEMR